MGNKLVSETIKYNTYTGEEMSDETTQNYLLVKLATDLNQSKYNLDKHGLYSGFLKEGIENLLSTLEDYDL